MAVAMRRIPRGRHDPALGPQLLVRALSPTMRVGYVEPPAHDTDDMFESIGNIRERLGRDLVGSTFGRVIPRVAEGRASSPDSSPARRTSDPTSRRQGSRLAPQRPAVETVYAV